MIETVVGKISITPKGEYSELEQYTRLDFVHHGNGGYLCIKDTEVETSITDDEYWMLVVEGVKGDTPTIEVGTVTLGDEDSELEIVNVGTSTNVKLDFTIPAGKTGETGKDFTIKSHFDTLGDLESNITNPEVGDIYTVGLDIPYDIYIYDGVLLDWKPYGSIQGAKGDKGDRGEKGDKGDNGSNGQDGFSPIANVTKTGNTATITITDKNGTTTKNVTDGVDGQDGAKGADGGKGDKGDKGDDGKSVELQTTASYIQWRNIGDITWQNVVALSTLKGLDGSDGVDGKSIELQTTATHIQWRQSDGIWQNLILLSSLKGKDGADGIDGISEITASTDTTIIGLLKGANGKVAPAVKSDITALGIPAQDTTYENATTSTAGLMSDTDKTKLNGVATGADVSVNADWNASSGKAQILNKPTIPNAYTKTESDSKYIQSETDPTVPSWAKQTNKPTYTASEIGAERSGAVSTHNSSGSAHSSLFNNKLNLSGGTMTGNLVSNNPAIATQATRNIYAGTTDLTAGSSALSTGVIYLVYE